MPTASSFKQESASYKLIFKDFLIEPHKKLCFLMSLNGRDEAKRYMFSGSRKSSLYISRCVKVDKNNGGFPQTP